MFKDYSSIKWRCFGEEKYFYTKIFVVIIIIVSDDQLQNCLQLFALEMVSTFSCFIAVMDQTS